MFSFVLIHTVLFSPKVKMFFIWRKQNLSYKFTTKYYFEATNYIVRRKNCFIVFIFKFNLFSVLRL